MDVIMDLLDLNSEPNVVYSDRKIASHILNASTSRNSVNHVSEFCPDAPSEGTIRYRMRNLDLDTIQQRLNEQLKIHGFGTILGKFNTFAIDFINILFYGWKENSGDTIRTKPKQGTSHFHFHAYASIYVILKNKHYALAVKYVRKGETLKGTVDFLINEIESVGFKIKGLYIDKEFYSVEVLNYLTNRKISFTIPCVNRGHSGGIR
jgi:putative transposase